MVSNAPGVVYNAMVWLKERDDVLAAGLLVEHESYQIAQLKEKIKNHENKIDILYKGVIDYIV